MDWGRVISQKQQIYYLDYFENMNIRSLATTANTCTALWI